jgi:hypothetical protein
VTGSERQCELAKELARAICAEQDGVEAEQEFGESWAHGRFSAPYLRDPLLDAGFAVDTMETAVDWGDVDSTLAAVETAIREAAEAEGEQIHVYTHLSQAPMPSYPAAGLSATSTVWGQTIAIILPQRKGRLAWRPFASSAIFSTPTVVSILVSCYRM